MIKVKSKIDNMLCYGLAIYTYLSLLPANSIYLFIIPNIRILALLIINILFFYKCKNILRPHKFLFLFVLGFFLINLMTILAHGELITNDIQFFIHVNLIYIFVSLPINSQIKVFQSFVFLGSILLLLGIIEYILYVFLSKGILLVSYMERGEDSGQYYSHGIFNVYQLGEIIVRFQGLFREPGFLGICAGLLLFKISKRNIFSQIVWGVSGLLSLSLAFYLLLFAAVVYHIVCSKLLLKFSRIFVIVSITVIILGAFKEILNDAVYQRIENYVEEGDNRTKKDFNYELENLQNTSNIIYGYGFNRFISKGFSWGNTGIKADLYKYGYLGILIFVVSFYVLLNRYKFSFKDKVSIFILFLICYYNADVKYAFHIYLILLSLYLPTYENFAYNSRSFK